MSYRILTVASSLVLLAGFPADAPGWLPADETSLTSDTSLSWPQWMGPRYDGVSRESGWSTEWPAAGLPIAWTAELGIGFSSFSIVDGLLYTMGHTDGEETVWCLDAETGRAVWQHSYPARLNDNLYEGGPGSTPTVDGDFVYSLSVDGRLLCFQRRTGDVLWERSLQQDLGVRMHEWGFNGSPLILENQLILEAGRLVSYDKRTGEKNWQSPVHAAGYGSVRSLTYDGQTLLASLDCDGLRISQAATGEELAFTGWESPFRTNSTTPIIVENTIFISTGYNVGSALFRLEGSGSRIELKQVYATRAIRNHFNNSILYEGYLYGFDGNSNLGRVVTLTCMDHATGDVMWKQRGLGCGSLMIAAGKLIILGESGDLVIADANPDGYTELARSGFLEGRCWTVPLLLNGNIYGRNAAGKLVCVKLPKSLNR